MKKSKAIFQISISMYEDSIDEYKYLLSKNINISYEVRKLIKELYKINKENDNISSN